MADLSERTVPPSLILASGSRTRLELLQAAGLSPQVVVSSVDEDSLKAALKADAVPTGEAALLLAELKALRVSQRMPGALVIGADQMLDCDGQWFDKPADRAAARTQLQALRGKTHRLLSAVVICQNGQRIWHDLAIARLTMRTFSDSFLEQYLDQAGDAILSSVGAYQIEGCGIQLFTRTEGDHATIMGLPLLPLLEFLRMHRVLES